MRLPAWGWRVYWWPATGHWPAAWYFGPPHYPRTETWPDGGAHTWHYTDPSPSRGAAVRSLRRWLYWLARNCTHDGDAPTDERWRG